MNRSYLFFFLLLAPAACADTTMSLAGFDTSCTQDSDCAVVETGSICGCFCGNAAINESAVAAYQSEEQAKEAHCPKMNLSCECPIGGKAVCTQGQCAYQPLAQ